MGKQLRRVWSVVATQSPELPGVLQWHSDHGFDIDYVFEHGLMSMAASRLVGAKADPRDVRALFTVISSKWVDAERVIDVSDVDVPDA